MSETIMFDNSLSIFQNLVVVYCDENGKKYIGNTYYYNGRGNLDYMCVMCKDSLPDNMDLIMAWNWLDDNSPAVTLVPEVSMETGVEDFLYAHGKTKDWKTVSYHVIEEWPDMEKYIKDHPIKNGEVIGFGIKK